MIRERHFNYTRLEIRSASNPGTSAGTLIGYASVFSTSGNKFGLSDDLGGWKERCDYRAFDKVLADPNLNTFFLINHDPNQVCARTKNGTLKLMTDNIGLRVAADVAPTSYGKDLVENIHNGNLDSMSFGFTVDKDDWNEEDIDGEKTMVRTLRSIASLEDVSAVLYPAYNDTRIQATEVSSASPIVMGRSIPESAPLELRSRFAERRQALERRRNFTNFILSL
jgi:Escherichia/Staphylococcus phage prohead protease